MTRGRINRKWKRGAPKQDGLMRSSCFPGKPLNMVDKISQHQGGCWRISVEVESDHKTLTITDTFPHNCYQTIVVVSVKYRIGRVGVVTRTPVRVCVIRFDRQNMKYILSVTNLPKHSCLASAFC